MFWANDVAAGGITDSGFANDGVVGGGIADSGFANVGIVGGGIADGFRLYAKKGRQNACPAPVCSNLFFCCRNNR